jgi:cytochrome c peroxidase
MKQRNFLAILVLFVTLGLVSCDDPTERGISELQLDLPDNPYDYQLKNISNHLPTLGRVLFYDPRLSINNTISCSSCHKQALAFADNERLSRGFENRLTERNSMPIQNIISPDLTPVEKPDSVFTDPQPNGSNDSGYMPGVVPTPEFLTKPTHLFWDGRETDLRVMVTRPIVNHVEMGMQNMDVLVTKLAGIPEYSVLFTNAFGTNDVTEEKISKSLRAFLMGIKSNQSKFDQAVIGNAVLNANEALGRLLFFEKFNCNSCHEEGGFADIGLEKNPSDDGLARTSKSPGDVGKFKIPSLRNIALTGPYMHDGRFATLESVLNHYSENIKQSPNLDIKLKDNNGKAKRMNMTTAEKNAIVAFLNTLTDFEMITDPKTSSPFHSK